MVNRLICSSHPINRYRTSIVIIVRMVERPLANPINRVGMANTPYKKSRAEEGCSRQELNP